MYSSYDRLNSSAFLHAFVALLTQSYPHFDSYIKALTLLHVNQTGTVSRQRGQQLGL